MSVTWSQEHLLTLVVCMHYSFCKESSPLPIHCQATLKLQSHRRPPLDQVSCTTPPTVLRTSLGHTYHLALLDLCMSPLLVTLCVTMFGIVCTDFLEPKAVPTHWVQCLSKSIQTSWRAGSHNIVLGKASRSPFLLMPNRPIKER